MMRSVIRPASLIRSVPPVPRLAALALLAAALALPAPASARKAPKPSGDKADASDEADAAKKPDAAKKGDAGKPVEVGTYGDWGAYLAKGKGKTCYALAKPQERKAEGRKGEGRKDGRKDEAGASAGRKDAAYVFIADRPNEKVHNEVSIMMGFPIKESGAAQALVGKASFDLVAKGSNAWIKNPDEEAKFVEALQHSAKLVVKVPPVKGPLTVDSYSLAGLKQALAQVGKDCR